MPNHTPDPFKLLMFDLDDTLYDFTRNWPLALKATFQQLDFTRGFELALLYETFEKHSTGMWPLVESGQLSFQAYRFRRLEQALLEFARPITEEEYDSFNRLFIEQSLSRIERDEALITMFNRFAAEGRQLAIVTNGPGDISMQKLERLGLERHFNEETVVISEKVGYAKPDSRIYRRMLDFFGTQPEQALFIGDSWHADVQGPMQAGIAAVWVNRAQLPIPSDASASASAPAVAMTLATEPVPALAPYATIKHIAELNAILSTLPIIQGRNQPS
ncbi:HAD family hydrolase [Paenibacillus koleovorans]|uniref:HAD family hydrolase n=1 Tax=Paenibacillus koleovorans TaxID=121608 RepID=UPI000FD72D9C|nr:HAD family hydrolase [Paenibacillus koleovorans]